MTFINQYCCIQKQSLIQQGNMIFTSASGTLDNFLDEAFKYLSLSYSKFYKMDRLSKLGFLASEMLLKETPLFPRYSPDQVAVVLSNAASSLDTDLRFKESVKTIPSPGLFVYTLPNIVAGEICIRQGITGENAFFVSPEFEAQQMADYVSLVLALEKTQACIGGWIEVTGDHNDVFLYLVEKERGTNGVEHTAEQLRKIYNNQNYGTIDRKAQKSDY
jgi:hypothetical protein